MARGVREKVLVNARLGSNYGSWMYCDSCGETVGYLCYVTYDTFDFQFTCTCGGQGSIHVEMMDGREAEDAQAGMVTVKNRLCCPEDGAPLCTVREDRVTGYTLAVSCHGCGRRYRQEKKA